MCYIKYCKILRYVTEEATKQHYSRFTAKSNNKIKTTWNIIKKERGKIHSVELVNGEKLKDLTNMAIVFNYFFITVNEKLNTQHTQKEDSISILKDSFPGNFPSIKIIPITKAEIKRIIHSLK